MRKRIILPLSIVVVLTVIATMPTFIWGIANEEAGYYSLESDSLLEYIVGDMDTYSYFKFTDRELTSYTIQSSMLAQNVTRTKRPQGDWVYKNSDGENDYFTIVFVKGSIEVIQLNSEDSTQNEYFSFPRRLPLLHKIYNPFTLIVIKFNEWIN